MTREEAIEILEGLAVPIHAEPAFDMAIEALKAQADLQPNCNELATDTISRQDAIDAILAVTGNSSVRELYEHVQEHGLSEMWSGGVSAAIDVIIAVPSAQPEIIRCRDCKYWREHKYAKETKRYIPFCGFNAIYTKADDFCSRAERRTE